MCRIKTPKYRFYCVMPVPKFIVCISLQYYCKLWSILNFESILILCIILGLEYFSINLQSYMHSLYCLDIFLRENHTFEGYPYLSTTHQLQCSLYYSKCQYTVSQTLMFENIKARFWCSYEKVCPQLFANFYCAKLFYNYIKNIFSHLTFSLSYV